MLKLNLKDEIPQGGKRLYHIIDNATNSIVQQNCEIRRANDNEQDGTRINALLLKQIIDEINNNTPIGVIHEYAGVQAPAGYLFCKGQAVSRSTYADLFRVIGTTYGSGDGSTTFNLPNLCGRIPAGIDDADSDFNALGKKGGSKTHTLTVEQMPSHTHIQNTHTHSVSGTSQSAGAHTHSASSNSTGSHTHTLSGTAASAGAHSHNVAAMTANKHKISGSISTSSYSSGSGYTIYGGMVVSESAGAHSHTISGTAASGGAHSHTITVNSNGAHTHTIDVSMNSAAATNQYTGGGKAHNNIQPYIVMNYIIKY